MLGGITNSAYKVDGKWLFTAACQTRNWVLSKVIVLQGSKQTEGAPQHAAEPLDSLPQELQALGACVS